MDSKPLQPSSRPRNIRRHSAPARHAPFEFLPNLNNLPEIFVQPPQSAPATPAYEEHDPSLLKPPPFRFSSRTKPLFSPSQPSISLPPVNSHTLPEQPDLSQQQIFTMGGAVYSQEMIRDLVRLVLENAATFFQGFIDVKVLGRLISDFQSLEAELLDLLKFGDPRGYTTAFMTVNENLQPKPRSYATMKYTSDFKRVFRSIQTDASYATFPISNNLIIFARIVRRKLHTRRVGSLEIAELLLEHTENTQSGPGAVEVNVNPSTLLVIGKDMLNSYVEMLSCTRTPMGWSGWYSAKRNNRKANQSQSRQRNILQEMILRRA
ncbi:hypothetical protein BKA64DRAFT_670354 [Cadophora sp. MPI-SDFR-AT-0126]|nr:hypothetical protein BKA64DRAFT_670354 [Leotiomycetes sp. MPI-SDFR-AT-0126]